MCLQRPMFFINYCYQARPKLLVPLVQQKARGARHLMTRSPKPPRRNTMMMGSTTTKGSSHMGIGDRNHHLMQLSDKDFMREINTTREQFNAKFPELSNIIFEYNKQCTLLQLDFWYAKPLPPRCERFFEADVHSLMDNIEEHSEAGKAISQLCAQLLCDYLPHKYQRIDV